jgi:phosphoribosyl-ATP pyrophosphohydrolase/phosphoribosyl-AMP cyclohydrolase
MDETALAKTRETGEVHFWSRSRQRLWKKGETSGHVLVVVEIKTDCDADTLLVRALPHGPTCHTGSQSCFGCDGREPPPGELFALEETVRARLTAPPETRSYVRALAADGAARIGEKIVEEANELVAELVRPVAPRERVVAEAADLLFHVLVGLAAREVTLTEVMQELHRRAGTSGLDEKAARKPT